MNKIVSFTILTSFLTACGADININNNSISTYIGNITTRDAPSITDGDFASFDAIAIQTDNNNATQTITLTGTAVQDSVTASGSSFSISRINQPIISLDFDKYGDIARTDIYIGNKNYTANQPSISDNVQFSQSFSDPDDGEITLMLSRNFENISLDDDIWNFTAKYMMHINWDVDNDDIYNDGYMIAGFETAGADINNEGEARFYGNGQGYHTIDIYSPSPRSVFFNVIADVDFTDRTVELQMLDTQYCTTNTQIDCNSISELNFDTTLRYDAGKNNLSGDVEAFDMIGTAQARFYGTGDDEAQELGGTFAMRYGERRYIGSFGAIRNDIGRTDIRNLTNDNDILSVDNAGYASLEAASTAANTDNEDKKLILSALAVQKTNAQFYHRPDSNPLPNWNDDEHLASEYLTLATINAPLVSLTFNGNGHIKSTSLHYVGDKNYNATLDGTGSDTVFSENFNGLGNNITSNITINREFDNENGNIDDFTAQYMMNISWDIDDDDFSDDTTSLNNELHGYMMAGFETAIGDIPTEGIFQFTGNGGGYFRLATGSGNAQFNVTADVDFAERTVELQTTNTSASDCFFTCPSLSRLNFTTTLTYEEETNNISGTVDVDDMIGTAEARFYGTDDGTPQELGGTFAMRQNTYEHYYGYFGATRTQFIESFDDFSAIDAGGIDRIVEFSSTAVETRIVADLTRPDADISNSWFYADNITITDASNITLDDATITEINFFSPRIEITYRRGSNDGAGLLTNALVTLGSQTYMLDDDDDNGDTTQILRNGFLHEDNTTILSYMEVSRSAEIFGFESKYMVSARWNQITDSDSIATSATGNAETEAENVTIRSGFMISGFATGRNALDTRGINIAQTSMPTEGEATFTGKGFGYYATKPMDEDEDMTMDENMPIVEPLTLDKALQAVEFDVNVTSHFTDRNVTIETLNTMGYVCTLPKTQCTDAERTDLSHLNFNAKIENYTSNNIRHIFNGTDGNDIDGMTGDIDARFYGPEAEEFGGTFQVSDDERTYMGAFGAEKTSQ